MTSAGNQFLVHQIARGIVLFLVNNVNGNRKKTSQTVKTDEILKACALVVICTRVHLCNMRMHVFSQSEARNFFSCISF